MAANVNNTHLLEHDDLVRIPQPRVQDAAGVRRPERLLVVDAPGEHLLGEGHHVGAVVDVGGVEVVLVGPHLAGGAAARLDLVAEEGDPVLGGDLAQAL